MNKDISSTYKDLNIENIHECHICWVEIETEDMLICTMCLHNKQEDIKNKLKDIDSTKEWIFNIYWINKDKIDEFLKKDYISINDIDLLEIIQDFLFTWNNNTWNWYFI